MINVHENVFICAVIPFFIIFNSTDGSIKQNFEYPSKPKRDVGTMTFAYDACEKFINYNASFIVLFVITV